MKSGLHEHQILVVIKEPGQAPRVEPLFDNDLKAFQEAVGGYIETVTVTTDLTIICNEEGRLKNLPWNVTAFGVDFVGTILRLQRCIPVSAYPAQESEARPCRCNKGDNAMTFDEWTKQRKNTQQAAPSGASSRPEKQDSRLRTASAGAGSQSDLDIISSNGGVPTFDQWTAAHKKTDVPQSAESADLDSVAKELELLKTVKQESDLLRRKAATAATSVSSYITDRQAEIYRQYGTDEEINRKIWDYEGKLKYHRLSDNEDYAEKSKYYESDRNAVQNWAANMIADEYEDRAYTYINTGSLPKGVGLIDEGDYKPLTTMTETEKKNFNYLYRTGGRQTAGEYLDYIKSDLDGRYADQVKEKAATFAAEHEMLGSAASVPLNLLSGLGTVDVALQMAGKKIEEAVTGEYAGPVNYNSKWMLPNAVSSTVRDTVATKIADNTGRIALDAEKHPILSRILNGKSLGDVYQLGMSMADSAAVAGISKSLNINGTALLGGSAATQGMLDAVEKGASDEQALAMGILNGAFEMLFEKYELESLLGADSNMLRSMAKQALSEGVGEGATTIANTVADTFIMAEKSDWQTKINEYVNAGLSPEKAKKQAFLDMAIQVGWDLAGGIVSGTIMGGGASAINKAGDAIENVKANHAAGKAVTTVPGGVEALKQASATTAQELNGSAQKGLQRLSDKVSAQQAGGVTAKIRNLVNTQRAGKLYRQTASAVNDLNAKDLAASLEAKGWDKEKAASVAQATATAAVSIPSQEQYRLLESVVNDPVYQQVVKEIMLNDQSMVNQRRERIEQVLEDHSAEQEAEPVAENGVQESFPTFQEEVQRQFEETNGYRNPERFDTETPKEGNNVQANATNQTSSVPLSIADQLRQEQIQNGGVQNVNSQEQSKRTAYPHNGGGNGLLHGGAERNAGTGTAEQAGVLASSPEQRRSAYADRSRATVARQNYARSLRLEKVSSLDLGLQNGTEARNVQVMPQEHWDAEMSQLADRIYNETGKSVTFVMGRIQIRGASGAVGYARGVITGDRIIVQADHLRIPMEQIADHEAYHAKVDFSGGRLNDEIRRHIVETFSEEQFRQVLDKYIVSLRGVIDVNEAKDAEEFEAAVRKIEEEIFADAYAGINAFSAGADQFIGTVNEKMDQLGLGKIRNQDNGTKKPTGPPKGERYSTELDTNTSYEGRSLTEDPEIYTYDFLISQPAMKPVELPAVSSVRDTEGKIDTTIIADNGIKNALSVGTEKDGRAYVKNRYTGRDLWVTTSAIRHGLNGTANRLLTNARLGSVIGEIVQNAIPINALHNTADGVQGTYAMAGYAFDRQGREFVAIITVEQRTDAVAEIDVYDVTHAISGRQKRGEQVDTKSQGFNPSMLASKISIADFLQAVKSTYRSILSENVLDKMSESKSADGYYTGRVRYSVDVDVSDEQGSISAESPKLRGHTLAGERDMPEPARADIAGQNVRSYANAHRQDLKEQEEVWRKRMDESFRSRMKEIKKPPQESLPVIARQDLKKRLLDLFSIPSAQRVELGDMIDSYADRLIKNGSLTEDDRKAFFDRMYDAGVMVMPAEEYSAFARNHIADGRIYVSDSVKSDFGADWADIRRRAFAAGVYLVNDRSASNISQWNTTLSSEDMLPGLFDSEETDERTILERILQVAEEGKDEHLSLAEYTRRLSQQEGISEDEFLDNMERQLDWALRTFAEKAHLEIKLRDRTGIAVAREKERGRQRIAMERYRDLQRQAKERRERREKAQRAKDRKALQELQQRTLKQLQWLNKNRHRAPEELKATWDEVLGDIDLYAVGAANEMLWSDKHNATWKDLAQMYKDAMKNDPNFLPSKELERIVTRLDAAKIADMDLGALQDLYKAAIGLRTEFYNRNNVINDEMQRLFAEVYTDAKREIESAPGGFNGGVADKLLNLDQLTPMNVLQRMAGWDPDGAFYSMAKQLERGERDMRAYSVKAQKMLQDFLTEHGDWVKKADGQGKDAIWYEVEVPQLLELGMGDKPIFGPTVKVYMTPAQKVHMFLESQNLDNLRHMTGGRTFVDKDLYSQGKRQEALSQGRTIKLAPETVRKLVSDLTPEEMELARILDRYYNTFATQEINKVSNILYGYDKAMGKNYAPIYTNRNYTKTEFGVFDTTAEGVGNLKGRQYAVNPSYNISAFDAFERHVDQTARFCGMAIPARNWTTLMNWREKNNSTGDVITHKWGEESKRYITDLITTLQAGDDSKTDTISSGLSKLQSNYITAIFGANPSIVLKQLGSIPMAGTYLGAKNRPTLAQVTKIDRSLISKYTQELEWRTMGYATPETKQLKDNPNWTQTNKAFKFVFGGGAITAMDGWAASTLWPWAENKVRREYPELAVGTKAQVDAGESAFYKKVAEEFESAISRSQSVSDEIHQSTLRKSKNPITKAFTMFRSDSAQTYNALRQKVGEARYYMRTGANDKAVRAAKKAVGTAFVAMLLNAAWAEAINFLMALWKNKGKYYRDDEEELTFQSVAGEMVSNMLGSFAGVVTGGEELFEVIGNILTGEKLYDIETPGMEQLNDLINTVTTAGGSMRNLVAGGWDILKNGGNLGEYFSKHSGQILGNIKDLVIAAAMYLPGLPASNLEAYLVGSLKWISPELGVAYDDLFSNVGKDDLAGMEGGALESRIDGILSDRNVSESENTAAALAALYEAGYKAAIPSDTPTSVSINGEKQTLGVYQQQAYDTIWGGIVADALDNMVASDSFKEADLKTKAKMLENLYDYAAERAKAELFDEYEMDTGAAENAAIVAAGATVAECITWNTITSGKNPDGTAKMKSGEKAAELASWDIPEEAKREIFHSKISDSREDCIAAFDEAGLSFDQFLQAYSKYAEVNANAMWDATMKATAFARWVDYQGYSSRQVETIKDTLRFWNMTPAEASKYEKLTDSGLTEDEAYELTDALGDLEPLAGADDVTVVQEWRLCVDMFSNVATQLSALAGRMDKDQFAKVEIANRNDVNPDTYVTLKEILPRYDADGNGSLSQKEVKKAIDSMSGLSKKQRAVLWQLSGSKWSAKNNPYSTSVGQKVADALAEK